jgi:anti-sigma factor RsiW
MTDRWTPYLSPYVDGEMDAGELGLLEAHLETCAECRVTVRQLRGVLEWAQTYPGTPPARDGWRGIAAAIREPASAEAEVVDLGAARTRRRRPTLGFTVPRAVAAAALLLLAGAAGWWLRGAGQEPMPAASAMAELAPAGGSHAEAALLAAQKYSTAVAELERALLVESRLDTSTARVIRDKLGAIDRAITEARQALAADPESAYLAEHYAHMMGRKLALLRNASRAEETRVRS